VTALVRNGEITGDFGLKWLREASHDEEDYLIDQHDQRKGPFGGAHYCMTILLPKSTMFKIKEFPRKNPKSRHRTGHPVPFGPGGNFSWYRSVLVQVGMLEGISMRCRTSG
jgi:hypothetical protein